MRGKGVNMEELLYINKNRLELLLEKKKDFIGYSWRNAFEQIVSCAVIFFSDIYGFQGKGTFFIVAKTILTGCVIYYLFNGLKTFVKCLKNKYTSENLKNDIETLNMPISKHSLIAIKDTFNEYPKRFLLYYDTRWDCYLFPNYKTPEDSSKLIQKLSNDLEIPIKNISIDYKVADTHIKYSVSNQKYKTYEHRLYQANISEFTDISKQDNFIVAGKQFKWFSIEEMFSDTNIQNKNASIVDFVNKNIV